MAARLTLGFIPLNDAAPLIVARDKGFFAAEGLDVELSREASWATIRDKVAVGALDGAHMLAPMTLAASLGVGSERTAMLAPLALNHGGAAITVSRRLADVAGEGAAALARLVERRKAEGASRLTFSVVFPYSIHNYLLRDWMAQVGIDPDNDVRLTVSPPPRMTELLAEGVIEGFCAGEPWNAAAVAWGAGRVAARSSSESPGALDKVLGMTRAWASANPETLQAVLRALVRASTWVQDDANRVELAGLLAHPDAVDLAPDVISRGLRDITFGDPLSAPPRPPRVERLVGQMERWGHLPDAAAGRAEAAEVFRPDLAEAALRDTAA